MLKFFSKNKKGVSETNQAYENVGQESQEIRKLVKPIHAKAILADGRLYDTQTATYVCKYCETKRKGREDVFSKNHKPQPQ